MEKKIPVIIDCDPGHDDMMALVLACGSEKLDVRAVTTVAGNKPLELVTKNALNVLHYIGKSQIPVGMGYDNPMVRRYDHAAGLLKDLRRLSEQGAHGASGLDGFTFPEGNPMTAGAERAVELMARVLRESEEKVTIIPVGPLTNVGLLIRAFPDLVGKIGKISLMGGSCNFKFTRQYMEFNTFLDPEATRIVFESGVPIDMYGYDVTYRTLYGDALIERVRGVGNQTGDMVSSLLETFREYHNKAFAWLNLSDLCPIHDACAVAGVIDERVIKEAKMMHVDIETKGDYMAGATICDDTDILGLPHNVRVIFELDQDMFFDQLVQSVSNLN